MIDKERWERAGEILEKLIHWRAARCFAEYLRDLLVDCRTHITELEATRNAIVDMSRLRDKLTAELNESKARVAEYNEVIKVQNGVIQNNTKLICELWLKTH